MVSRKNFKDTHNPNTILYRMHSWRWSIFLHNGKQLHYKLQHAKKQQNLQSVIIFHAKDCLLQPDKSPVLFKQDYTFVWQSVIYILDAIFVSGCWNHESTAGNMVQCKIFDISGVFLMEVQHSSIAIDISSENRALTSLNDASSPCEI